MSATHHKGLRRVATIMVAAVGLSVVGLTGCGSEPEVDPPATSNSVAVAKNAALTGSKGKKLLPGPTTVPNTLKMPTSSVLKKKK